MGVFATHNAIFLLGAPVSLQHNCPPKCLRMFTVGTLGTRNAGFWLRMYASGCALNTYASALFEIHNPQKCVSPVWCTEDMCTKKCQKKVLGHLLWACLECAMPKSVCLRCGGPNTHTFAQKHGNKSGFGHFVWVCSKYQTIRAP